MPISSLDDFIEGIKLRMGSNSANVSDDGYAVGADTAMNELGWSLPLDQPLKVLWAYNRAVRHCVYILMIESAHKFRYKEIFLQNRFAHYKSLIDDMDKSFEKAQEDNPDLFLDSVYTDDNAILSSIAYYIPNCRDYDWLGRIR